MGAESTVGIGLLLPDLLGTYGDAGNATVLHQRLHRRGIRAQILPITLQDAVPAGCELYVIGGGEDGAQRLAIRHLRKHDGLQRAVAAGSVVLAVCAGLQILGWRLTGSDHVEHRGLDLLDVTTSPRIKRAVGEVIAKPQPDLLNATLTGFENHQGATGVGPAARPLARVIRGVGNGAGDHSEGVVQGRIIGTYLHGPVLARNPDLADLLLGWALGGPLTPLDMPSVTRLRANRLGGAHRAGPANARSGRADQPATAGIAGRRRQPALE